MINKDILSSNSSISIAKTILHECIHAYLNIKQYGCNEGTTFEEMDNKELANLLNEYFEGCEPLQGQHGFMFNHMIPTMSGILAEIKDDLIPANHQISAESELFINEDNPATWPSGNYKFDTPWNWDNFYEYLSMGGLQESDAFAIEIQNSPVRLQNYNKYRTTGRTSFSKNCTK